MNTKFLLLALGIAGLTGCATSYKTGQTPDDVYFSPTPKYEEKETVKDEEENRDNNYYDYRDRAARLKSSNYRRWNSLDNPYYFDGYSYSPSYNYRYNYSYGYSYNYNPYIYNNTGYYGNTFGYGGYSNGYCPYPTTSYGGPRNTGYTYQPKYNAPRGGGSTGYRNNGYSNTNNVPPSKGSSGTFGGAVLNRVFSSSNTNSNSNNNSNSNSSSPVRTYEPASSSGNSGSGSGSSGSSGGGGGGVSRPPRNGG